jgi:hypothetical protein
MDQLTLDSIAAQKAGMSYGKWKALQPLVQVKAAPDDAEKVCEICGREIPFRGRGSGREKKYTCSDRCAEERHRRLAAANYRNKKAMRTGCEDQRGLR